MTTGALIAIFQIAASVGYGAAVLRLLRISSDLNHVLFWSLAFTVGQGVIGWIMFPLGVAQAFSSSGFVIVLAAGVGFLVWTFTTSRHGKTEAAQWSAALILLLGALAYVLFLDLMEALAPAADADSLAYHFNVPKQFLETGGIFYIQAALEGSVPLLVHMTYVPALGLGGEQGLTLWTTASGWAAGGLIYGICRNHADEKISLAAALVFLTTPAVLFGGGSGQVEVKLAAFVVVSAWAVHMAWKSGLVRYAILAGLAAGFYLGAKYTGALFCASAGIAVLAQRRWFVHGLLFGLAAVVAGFQWYLWNAVHTGDPFFPMLFQHLGRADIGFWSADYDTHFKSLYFAKENPLPRSIGNFFAFPVLATFGMAPLEDAGRVGLGVFPLLMAPLAFLAAFLHRQQIKQSPLLVHTAIAVLFFILWFFIGGSQRVRHLVPVLPLVIIVFSVAIAKLRSDQQASLLVSAAFAAVIVVQIGAHSLFSRQHLAHAFSGESDSVFIENNTVGWQAVEWINKNLSASDKVFTPLRQLRFRINVPNEFAGIVQSAISLDPDRRDVDAVCADLRDNGISHLLLIPQIYEQQSPDSLTYEPPFGILEGTQCLKRVARFSDTFVESRTLKSNPREVFVDVLALENASCRCQQ